MGNWIQLNSGGGYDFDKTTIVGKYTMERDLAYASAGLNRYVRHTVMDWQVAIHEVAVARCIERVMAAMGYSITEQRCAAAGGLLHDAHESVIGDIPTPVAWAIDYDKINALKEEVQLAIEQRLSVPPEKTPKANLSWVKLGDVAALHVEKQLFMTPEHQPWNYVAPPTEWTQTMYDVITEILAKGEHTDGGRNAFITEYHRLVLGD